MNNSKGAATRMRFYRILVAAPLKYKKHKNWGYRTKCIDKKTQTLILLPPIRL